MATVEIKRGATFFATFAVKLPSGAWHATSSVKSSSGVLIENLTASAITVLAVPDTDGNTHTGSLSATAEQTALWPSSSTKTLQCDIRFHDEEVPPTVIYTNKFELLVPPVVTSP